MTRPGFEPQTSQNRSAHSNHDNTESGLKKTKTNESLHDKKKNTKQINPLQMTDILLAL